MAYEFELDGKPLRRGREMVCVNPFAPEEEWITVEEFAERQRGAAASLSKPPNDGVTLRITKIDFENKTVTLE